MSTICSARCQNPFVVQRVFHKSCKLFSRGKRKTAALRKAEGSFERNLMARVKRSAVYVRGGATNIHSVLRFVCVCVDYISKSILCPTLHCVRMYAVCLQPDKVISE